MSREQDEQESLPLVQRAYFWPALTGTLLLLLACAIVTAFLALAERSEANRQLLTELLTVQAVQETAVPSSSQTPISPSLQPTQTAALSTATHAAATEQLPPTAAPTEGRKESDSQSGAQTTPAAPTVKNDTYVVNEDTTLTVAAANGLLANDTEVLTVSIAAGQVTQPVQGTVAVSSDGSFTYEPLPNFYGEDFFTYEACSVFNRCAVGAVTITVQPVNDPPVADDDTVAVSEDDTAVDLTTILLAGDFDEEANQVRIADVETANPERIIFGAAAGTVQYVPGNAFNSLAVGETAVDIFQYSIDDGKELSNSATVTVTVQGKNDAPLAQDDGVGGQADFTVDEDDVSGSLTSSLLSNDSDPDEADKSLLKIHSVSNNGVGGTAVLSGGGVTYDPGGSYSSLAEGETTTDTFSYIVVDPSGGVSEAATVEMTIRGVNQPPDLTISNLTNPVVFSSTLASQVAIAASVAINDVDNANLTDLIIRFVGGTPRPDGQAEYVQLTFQGEVITSTSDALSVSAAPLPLATFKAATQTAQYINTSPSPTAGCRQFEFQVIDADGGASTMQSITVQVDTAVCPPQVSQSNPREVLAVANVLAGISRRRVT